VIGILERIVNTIGMDRSHFFKFGRISAGVSGRNRNRMVWWLLHCSACWWCARSWV